MCTAISYQADRHYFGRNLDLEYSHGEKIVITPRNFPFRFKMVPELDNHYAMIGMAIVTNDYPLYFDGTNEFGLSMAGLNFPGNAHYFPVVPQKYNISPFEFIPWILSRCKTVRDARSFLPRLNLVNIPFNSEIPLSPLHWIIADAHESLVVESTKDGLQFYHNPIGILTNNPPFPYHLQNLCNYRNLTSGNSHDRFSAEIKLDAYSRGMGALGLPGDLSSASRFVRAAFTKFNSIAPKTDTGGISQFFHILNSVSMVRGCLIINDKCDITQYTSCCDTKNGIYYYTTYANRQICGIDMHKSDMDSSTLISYVLNNQESIRMEN